MAWVEIGVFLPISRYISEMVQDRNMYGTQMSNRTLSIEWCYFQ